MVATERSKVAGWPVQTVRVKAFDSSGTLLHEGEGERLTVGTAEGNLLRLEDQAVSRYHVELRATAHGIHVVDLGSTNGTHLGAVRVESVFVRPKQSIQIGSTTLTLEAGAGEEVRLHETESLHGMVGRSPAMRRLFSQIARVSGSQASVLLQGESGTGKEVAAQAIHAGSPRANGPFVVVDCGALVPTLIASELFGHERGAFTGAERQHIGAFERARGGTLLLDEVGELPAAVQAVLLGALERKRIRRVGGKVDIDIDVRVIGATHRDLRSEINAGRFRLDLFYRLAVVSLRLPALRERFDDLPPLIEHFARSVGFDGAIDALLSPAALESLKQRPFEGNLRELRNLVEALLAMGELPTELVGAAHDPVERSFALPYREARAAVLKDFEQRYVQSLLQRTGGNIASAAREARMDRSYLSELVSRQKLAGQ